MNKKKELIKNTIIILLGKVCTQFLSFFLLPLYTGVLSSMEYGVVDLITTYMVLIVPIITLQLEMALFRELLDARRNENKKKVIISSAFFSIGMQFIICLIICLGINVFINIPYKISILFNIVTLMMSNILLQIARGNGDNVGYSLACVIAGGFTIIFNILFLVVLNFKVEGMLLSTALGNSLAVIFLFFRVKLYKYIKYNCVTKKEIRRLLKYSIPLVPNGLIWWVINVSDRTLITWFIGVEANGIYAVSNKFSTILIQIYNVFNLSWTEAASIHINDEDKDQFFSDTFNNTIKIFSSICLLMICILPFVFSILINEEYYEAYTYIPFLLLGMIANIVVSFIGCIYVAKKMTKEVARTSFWSGVLNIFINIVCIKIIGIYAAVVSTILSFLLMSIYRYIAVQKYVRLKVDISMLFKLIILFCITLISYFYRNIILCFITLICVGGYLLYFNKDTLLPSLNKLRYIKR